MTPLEKEILDEVQTGIEYSEYLGDGDFVQTCAFCKTMLEYKHEHEKWCLTYRLQNERGSKKP